MFFSQKSLINIDRKFLIDVNIFQNFLVDIAIFSNPFVAIFENADISTININIPSKNPKKYQKDAEDRQKCLDLHPKCQY